MNYVKISGSVASPKGFTASGAYCGIKRLMHMDNTVTVKSILANESLQAEHKPDVALIVCEVPCSVGAVFTTNLVKGAPILVCREHMAKAKPRAIIVNSGNANTCNLDGAEKAKKMAELTASELGINTEEVLVASTGVIGQALPIEPFEEGIPCLHRALSKDGMSAARAIMTTDTVVKEVAIKFELSGKEVTIGAISKGSGMIHPNMATMLAFVTTDAAVSSEMLQKAIKYCADDTFNMLSVDGDTSTNDTLCILASGLAGNDEITEENEDFKVFADALMYVCTYLARIMAKDGEGATKLVECRVAGAENEKAAKGIAKSVICSPLVKSAMFGNDANWGRILCAIGYAGENTDVDKIDVYFKSKAGEVLVCEMGRGVPFSEEKATEILSQDEVLIDVILRDGDASATAFGCDLTYDYVKINGDYRT